MITGVTETSKCFINEVVSILWNIYESVYLTEIKFSLNFSELCKSHMWRNTLKVCNLFAVKKGDLVSNKKNKTESNKL